MSLTLVTIRYKARISDHVLNDVMCTITHVIDKDNLQTVAFEYWPVEEKKDGSN